MSDSGKNDRELIRLILIEPCTLMREGLVALLEREPAFRVVGAVGRVQDALGLSVCEPPDIILFEPHGLEINEDTPITQIRAALPHVRLILVTQSSDKSLYHRAVQLGAIGIVTKDQPAETLIKAIHKVYAGEAWLDRSMVANVITRWAYEQTSISNDPEKRRIALLSPREKEVIRLVAMGLKNKAIAKRLSISEHTVRHHLTSIFTKLQVADRLELMIFAHRHELGGAST